MNLTWKDSVATGIIIAIMAIAYAMVRSWDWPLLGSYRTASVIVLALGFGACIVVGSNVVSLTSRWARLASGLGMVAFAAGVVGVIFASNIAFYVLVIMAVILWFVSSLRHMLGALPGLAYK